MGLDFPKPSVGLDFPWLPGKAWRGEMHPRMVELRGMSVAGEELTEGGPRLALIGLPIALTKHSARSSRRLAPAAEPLDGSLALVGHTRQPPGVRGWWPPHQAGPPPAGAMLRRARADAQWNWHTPSLLLHPAWLMGPLSFKLFSLSFPLVFF